MKIGKDATTTNFDFAGDIAEILIFDRQLTAEEDEQVEGYLAHRWGATDFLLSDHTYKDLPPIFDNSPKITLKDYVTEVGAPAVAATVRESDMTLWYKFDETSGNSAADSGSGGHTGTLVNGPTFVAGKFGNAISFDGSNDRMDVPFAAHPLGTEVTIAEKHFRG